ncbi:hypothetical protein I7I50_07367 [Histoplasma capsulatum G186AR]|uniref:Uncharacterized protein n=1 Tax=Ajellomyces capsulatus TaxID=5037 RepID=A0A8H8D2L0_AJECA|nr:hypothetical protein I7I52_09561 [Histoplasma capsulatum]QSS68080.1 hypothetical protein I7I50_07367 [Histoplasma capsulatum G186AR]
MWGCLDAWILGRDGRWEMGDSAHSLPEILLLLMMMVMLTRHVLLHCPVAASLSLAARARDTRPLGSGSLLSAVAGFSRSVV